MVRMLRYFLGEETFRRGLEVSYFILNLITFLSRHIMANDILIV